MCGACGCVLEPDTAVFPCPRACGMRGCTIRCAQSHFEQGECPRKDFAIPRFGERFAGVNYPLTMAVALAGGAVQRPLGLMIADNSWDYFSEPGKDALEFLEEDPALRWRHWSPDSFSFTATLRRAGERKGKGKRKGHARLRTENQPWGVDRLSRDDQVIVRQENKMAKRCLKGLEPPRGLRGPATPLRLSPMAHRRGGRNSVTPGLHGLLMFVLLFWGPQGKLDFAVAQLSQSASSVAPPAMPLRPLRGIRGAPVLRAVRPGGDRDRGISLAVLCGVCGCCRRRFEGVDDSALGDGTV